MSSAGYPNSLQTYQSLLYRRALHPELFSLKARRTVKHNAYELEAWITPGGHVLRFKVGLFACSELVTDQDGRLPREGAVTAFPCAGDHEFEHSFDAEKVKFITSVQTETLTENLYAATYEELTEFGKDAEALMYTWEDNPSGFLGVANPAHSSHAAANGYSSAFQNDAMTALAGPSRRNLSMLDIQRLSKEIHIQAYHMLGAQGLVLRTQSIFEHR